MYIDWYLFKDYPFCLLNEVSFYRKERKILVMGVRSEFWIIQLTLSHKSIHLQVWGSKIKVQFFKPTLYRLQAVPWKPIFLSTQTNKQINKFDEHQTGVAWRSTFLDHLHKVWYNSVTNFWLLIFLKRFWSYMF